MQISLSNSFFVNEENILRENILIFSGYKSQYTLENVEEQLKKQKLCESEITEAASIKMFKITVFIIKKHWAHTTNFEDTVRFIGEDLHEQILSEYLKLSESHKNANYLLQNSVSLFITEISNWMKDETIKKMKEHENYTLLLDEATDESNRSELSLIARVVESGEVHNHFLSLLGLNQFSKP